LSVVGFMVCFMRDRQVATRDPAGAGAGDVSGSEGVVGWLGGLVAAVGARPDAVGDGERIDRIVAIDALMAALAAARVEETGAFCGSQLASQRACGVAERRLGAGIAEQVALARKMSPASGRRYVAMARTLTDSMPQTLDRMRDGEVSEWVASLVVRETASLTPADRRAVDREIAPRLGRMSPREAEAAARRRAYAIDPEATLRRSRTARGDRRVSIRPAPDTMALVTGFLPVEQGVAAWASLDRHARAMRASGDGRSLGQIMADTMVERLTGQQTAAAVPVEIGLTISLDTLTGADQSPAWLAGHGPLPAAYARALAHGHGDPDPIGSDRITATPGVGGFGDPDLIASDGVPAEPALGDAATCKDSRRAAVFLRRGPVKVSV
jgi:hypothetical protein